MRLNICIIILVHDWLVSGKCCKERHALLSVNQIGKDDSHKNANAFTCRQKLIECGILIGVKLRCAFPLIVLLFAIALIVLLFAIALIVLLIAIANFVCKVFLAIAKTYLIPLYLILNLDHRPQLI